ncbi:hypothetical protein SDC9_70891 [bioreactor metagenome]|uniref:Uncharacterized protein n=1 Tax=bioreactor metagenome TaxID=1076179 RepID=A0A644Y7X4_9ZZZZ
MRRVRLQCGGLADRLGGGLDGLLVGPAAGVGDAARRGDAEDVGPGGVPAVVVVECQADQQHGQGDAAGQGEELVERRPPEAAAMPRQPADGPAEQGGQQQADECEEPRGGQAEHSGHLTARLIVFP